jgi:drug/metabolite transporter (DMT)-like permease
VLLVFGLGSNLFTPTLTQFGWFALIAISTGMVALFLYYKGLSKTSVHVSTILELTFPFIAIILDMLVNDVTLVPMQWLAALVLVGSIYKISTLRENLNNG